MEITGRVHCFFEQSGTFKNEFIKMGIPAEDYDIQNNFLQTDHIIDLFNEIETEYRQDKTRQDKTKQNKTKQNNFCHNQRLSRPYYCLLSLHIF